MLQFIFSMGGKREGSAWSQGCSFIPFVLILSVYSVFKDLRCTLWFYEMNSYIYQHTHFQFHFLICSMRLAFLGFYSFSILYFINKGFLSFLLFLVNCLLDCPFFILLLLSLCLSIIFSILPTFLIK